MMSDGSTSTCMRQGWLDKVPLIFTAEYLNEEFSSTEVYVNLQLLYSQIRVFLLNNALAMLSLFVV